MNTRTFLKTLCLVPLGAVVEKLPGQGVAQVKEVTYFDVKDKLLQARQMYSSLAQKEMIRCVTENISPTKFARWDLPSELGNVKS